MSTVGATGNIPSFDPTLNTAGPSNTPAVVETTSSEDGGGSTPTPAPASYLSLPFARLTLENLGLQPSGAMQNVSILLDQVAAMLDDLFNENDKQRIANQASERRNAFTQILGLKAGVEALEARNRQLDQYMTEKKAERDPLITQRQGLIDQRTGLQNQVNALNTQRAGLVSQITTLDQQIAAEKDPAKKAALQTQRNNLAAQVSSIDGQVSGLNSQISGLNTQISALTTRIDALQKQIDDAQKEKDSNEARIDAMDTQIASLASALFLARAGIERLLGRDVPASGLDMAFDELVSALKEFDADLQEVQAFGKLQQVYDQDQELAKAIAKFLLAFAEAMIAVIKALAGIEPPPDADVYRTALTNGSRMRLPA